MNTPPDARLTIQQGAQTFPVFGRTLFDYFTYANLYQPCARMDPRAAAGPFSASLSSVNATNRCTALHQAGLLTGTTLAAQAAEALDKLRAYGYLAQSDLLHPTMYRFATNAIVVTYGNAYSRSSVADNVCGYSFANTNAAGAVIPQVLFNEERHLRNRQRRSAFDRHQYRLQRFGGRPHAGPVGRFAVVGARGPRDGRRDLRTQSVRGQEHRHRRSR